MPAVNIREQELKAPFPWFGGKSKVSSIIWEYFGSTTKPGKTGDVCIDNYIEPFAGSLAVLLGRPSNTITPKIIETVNDFDCYISNFWRALKMDPDQLAFHADYPVIEADLVARNNWLVENRPVVRDKVMADPDYYDIKVAAWWVWGMSQWIGGGFCDKRVNIKLPHLGGGEGINSRGKATTQRQHESIISDDENLFTLRGLTIKDRFAKLATRLATVRVACGDWRRVLGESVTVGNGITGILLDPPYSTGEHSVKYAGDTHQAGNRDIADEVREWAIEAGNCSRIRIALCGYVSEHHKMPEDWIEKEWKATGGYGNQGEGRGRENAGRERIWFSPACVSTQIRMDF